MSNEENTTILENKTENKQENKVEIERKQVLLAIDPAPTNMSICLIDINTLKIIDWTLFSIRDNTNEGTCKKLIEHLNNINTSNMDVIVVHEQQPRCNMKTLVICGQLQMYFTMKKLLNEDKTCCIKKIVGHLASHKLKYYVPQQDDDPMPMERINKIKKGHYKNKVVAVEHARRVLKQNSEIEKWTNHFETNKKRDDFSDSYLTALSYLKINKLGKFSQK